MQRAKFFNGKTQVISKSQISYVPSARKIRSIRYAIYCHKETGFYREQDLVITKKVK